MGFSRLGLTALRSGAWDAPRTYYDKDFVIWEPFYFTWATDYDSSAYYDVAYSFSTVAKDGGEVQAWSPWSDQKSIRKAKGDNWLNTTYENGAYVRRVNLVNLIPELFPTGRSHIWEDRRYDAIRIRFGVKAVDANGKDVTSRLWVTTALYYMPRVSAGDTTVTRYGLKVEVQPVDGWGRKDDLFMFEGLARSGSEINDVQKEDIEAGWHAESGGAVMFPWAGDIKRPPEGIKSLSMAVRPWYFDEPEGVDAGTYATTLVDASSAGTPTVEVVAVYNGDILVRVGDDPQQPVDTVLVEVLGSYYPEDRVEVGVPGTAVLMYAPYGEITIQATGLTETGIGSPVKRTVANRGEYVDLIPTADPSKRISVKTDIENPWSVSPVMDEVMLLGRTFPTVGYGDGVMSAGKVEGTYLDYETPTRDVEAIATAGLVVARFPNGERRRCAVRSVDTTNELEPGSGLRSVSVSLMEVG